LQQGVQPPAIDASQFLRDFDDYLMRVQGLALRTRSGYCFWARFKPNDELMAFLDTL
jgi:hypothetical protein